MDRSIQIKNYLRKMNRLPVAEIDPFKTYDVFDLWGGDNNNNVEYFFNHEHLLTKTACFWRLAKIVFNSKGRDQRWIDSFHRYRRFEFPFRDRLKATNTIYPPNLTVTEKEKITGFVEQETLNRYDKIFEEMGVEDELIIYRSFKVRKGEAVRKGVKKLDNPDAHIQVEGNSVSYTMNIVEAVGHQLNQFNPFFMRKYGDKQSKEDQKKYLLQLAPQMLDWQVENVLTDNAYSCLGTYSVKKKDIYFVDVGHMEEVVVNPESVKLIRYDFLSWAESMAGTTTRQVVQLFNKAGNGEGYSVGSNMQSFLDCVTKYYSLFYDYPDTIKKVWFSDRTETGVTEVKDKEEDIIRPILENIVYQNDDGTVFCDDKDVDWNDVKQQVSQL